MFVLCAALGISTGCTRAHYRRQADAEVYGLIGQTDSKTPDALPKCSIQPSPASRMYDPYSPDCEPMPPDDPVSHQLMQCVDGKRGWKHWGRNGATPLAENPNWLARLPRDAGGQVVLDRRSVVQLSLLHARDYQERLEDLYLSALDVTFQRFRFDAQFFGGHSTFFTADGPLREGGPRSELAVDNDLQMQKLFAPGGELVVGLANSLVWQFAGPDEYAANTLLDFSLVQPLLRTAGRAVVLENLTDAERALLANVRQMERFRKGFYIQTMAGQTASQGPQRGGIGLEAPPLPTAGATGGLLQLMSEQVRIRNQRQNVDGLRASLDQLEAFYEAGRIDTLQVDQARQALYGAQSALLQLNTNYEDRLDAYLISLGLPPETPARVDDPLLKQFDLVDPKLQDLQETVARQIARLRTPGAPVEEKQADLGVLDQSCRAVLAMLKLDLQKLDKVLPERRKTLAQLAAHKEYIRGEMDPGAVDEEKLLRRVAVIRYDLARQQRQAAVILERLKRLHAASAKPLQPARESFGGILQDPSITVLKELDTVLSELTLTQARCRLESLTLVPVAMDPDQAFLIARDHRLDWMNARAALVDTWRQIEVTANDLLSDLDVTFSGDMNTVDNNPVQFRSTTGRLRVGLRFDAPLTRLAERNLYRETLINYQRARRDYYTFEDRVNQGLRTTLRAIKRLQLDFEIRRAGVNVAINQAEVMQFRLARPLRTGETTVFGATTVRDLVGALGSLLNAENGLLDGWVDYEALRMNLDYDLGTMCLDPEGNWIDPGPIRMHKSAGTPALPPQPEVLPTPPAIPLPEALKLPEIKSDAPGGAMIKVKKEVKKEEG